MPIPGQTLPQAEASLGESHADGDFGGRKRCGPVKSAKPRQNELKWTHVFPSGSGGIWNVEEEFLLQPSVSIAVEGPVLDGYGRSSGEGGVHD